MCRAIDGVDSIGYEEPFVKLEVVGRDAEEGIKEFAGLQDCVIIVGFGCCAMVRCYDRGDGCMEFSVDDGPKHGEVNGGCFESESTEEHINVGARG